MVVIKKTKNKIVKKISTKTKVLKVIKKIIKPKKKTKIISKNKATKKKISKLEIIRKGKKKIVLKKAINKKVEQSLKFKKHLNNPIISPSFYSWESQATFNPTAFIHDDKIHIIYRAIGDDSSSVLGHAYTYDGINIEGRPTYHIYKRFFNYNEDLPKIDYISGGGWSGGCEDPRVVLIDNVIYMIFTAFDGWGSVRLALTSIKLEDFLNNRWNKWQKAVMISPPGEINKNWVLFPEKIKLVDSE